ncbi:MAG: hypothetical protein NTX03_08105 [Bacteroidetes bacterium]|nr:hypothetical protein [Bacteroidota bacterium]
MKKQFLIGSFLFISCFANAQILAKLTDRFMIKTDLLSLKTENALNLELETKLSHYITFSLGYYSESSKHNLKFEPDPDFTILYNITKELPCYINMKSFSYSFRIYPDPIGAAPFGFYTMFKYSYGKADILGYYGEFPSINPNTPYFSVKNIPQPVVWFTIMDVPVKKYNFSFGYQRLIGSHFYYDIAIGLQYYQMYAANATEQAQLNKIGNSFGTNLGSYYSPDLGGIGFDGRLGISYLIY